MLYVFKIVYILRCLWGPAWDINEWRGQGTCVSSFFTLYKSTYALIQGSQCPVSSWGYNQGCWGLGWVGKGTCCLSRLLLSKVEPVSPVWECYGPSLPNILNFLFRREARIQTFIWNLRMFKYWQVIIFLKHWAGRRGQTYLLVGKFGSG